MKGLCEKRKYKMLPYCTVLPQENKPDRATMRPDRVTMCDFRTGVTDGRMDGRTDRPSYRDASKNYETDND